jgi:pyruvate/2-oxoglutarate dehydrogenase complex dihydrolipoamide acyltransferase (E2) component
MTQGTFPPKLQFAPNMPVQVYFPYGDYKMIPSQTAGWQESYKYSTEVNDEKHTLFATPGLHRELQIRSIGPQCYVLITRAVELDDNNKEITRWQVLNVDGSERPAVEFTPEPPAASPAAAPAAPSAPQTPPAAPQPQGAVMAAPGSREDARLVWRSCVTLMGVCIEQAQKIYTDAGYEIEKRVEAHDIHATATTLFIQVSRATDPTLLLKQEAAAPAPAPPPQPQPPAAPPSPQEAPANPADDDLPF